MTPAEIIKYALENLEGSVYALLSGYPASCFARVKPDGLDLPPPFRELQTAPFELPWNLFSDIRIFSESGEVHAWRSGLDWASRTRQAGEGETLRVRHYPVLGTRITGRDGDWTLFSEDRGPAVWVPSEHETGINKRPALRVIPVIEKNETGVYGITDAMINGFAESKEADRDE